MKRHMLVAAIIFLLAFLASSIAWAHGSGRGAPGYGFRQHGHAFSGHGHRHHRHHRHFDSGARVGIIIGTPFVQSWHYRTRPDYVYTYPPLAVAPASPPVFIERGSEPASAQQPAAFWYYCDSPQGYYPQVGECGSGWRAVPAGPPVQPQ